MKKILFLLGFIISLSNANCWNEEKCDSLGNVQTCRSLKKEHSTFHYDLVKVLCMKAGISEAETETIARYSALVDQLNPKSDYPYPNALNTITIPDTFPDWKEGLAGTERGSARKSDTYEEVPAIYWHFPFRNPNQIILGGMVYGNYPTPTDNSYSKYPYYWRVPFKTNLDAIQNWALYNGGQAGRPDEDVPVDIMYFDSQTNSYKAVEPNSIQAFGVFIHSLADSYSHEFCMVNDTIRSHPPQNDVCGLTYHTYYEYAYDTAIYADTHAEKSIQATWRAIIEYKNVHNISTPVIWSADNNGFEDGDGIPDELEERNIEGNKTTFVEKWKSPAAEDLNGDGVINHSDHSTWRIKVCNEQITSVNEIITFDFKVFPNPANDRIIFRFDNSKNNAVYIQIYDLYGNKLINSISSRDFTGNEYIINIENLLSGIYFYQFVWGSFTGNGKFVVCR